MANNTITQEQYQDYVRRGLIAEEPSPAEDPKPAKYRNKKVEYEGFTFDSKRELRRYLDLRAEQQAGTISELRCQVDFGLIVNGDLICNYIADFCYMRKGSMIVEDSKSKMTRKLRDYRIKVKLMRACHGLNVIEV